jgi:ArsR family transcriptional regulator, arsenate/arsenite/antimonite-responsive transcriptional repressor
MYQCILRSMSNLLVDTLGTDTEKLETAAWIFKALSDPARLKILAFLSSQDAGKCCGSEDGVCACDLEGVINLSQPTVSHHMKALISANLVLAEKRGKWMFYRIDPKGFAFIKSIVSQFEEREQVSGFGAQ